MAVMLVFLPPQCKTHKHKKVKATRHVRVKGISEKDLFKPQLKLFQNDPPVVVVSPKPVEKNMSEKATDNENVSLLSHIVESEAGDQSSRTKLYVASVVVNRTKDKRFPSTIKDVIFQHGQYQNVHRAMNLSPSNDSVECAKLILNNGSVLPQKVVYQSQSPLGKIFTKSGSEYFCY